MGLPYQDPPYISGGLPGVNLVNPPPTPMGPPLPPAGPMDASRVFAPGAQPGSSTGNPEVDAELARRAAAGPGEPPAFPGTEGSTQGGLDSAEGTAAYVLGKQTAMPYASPGGGVQAPVMPAYDDYQPLVGNDQKLWQDTFVNKPKAIDAALSAGAQAQQDEGNKVADFYGRQQKSQQEELSVLKARQIERQAQVDQAQQQLVEAGQRYSNDLADRGQFWRNPGHMVAAFATALMALGGNGIEGVKLIQDQVNQDFMQRRQAADMHLGELRSNVSAYRQIAGDKDLGDRLAYAESTRVAAMELQRIAAQFQGPIAKAKAAAISAEMLHGYQIQMMQIHQAGVFNKERLGGPLDSAIQARGSRSPGLGPTPLGGQSWGPKPGTVSTGSGGGTSGSGTGFSGSGSTSMPSTEPREILSQASQDDLNRRYPGSSAKILALRGSIVREQLAKIGVNPNAYDPRMTQKDIDSLLANSGVPGAAKKFNVEMAKTDASMSEDFHKVSVAAQPYAASVASVKQLGRDIQVMEAVAGQLQDRKDPDMNAFFDQSTKQIFGSGNVNKIKQYLDTRDPGTKHEKVAQEIANGQRRFEQLLAGNANDYIHSKSGGAVSESEQKRMDQFANTDHSWNSVKGFHQNLSRDASANLENAARGARNPLVGTLWLLQNGTGTPPLVHEGIAGPDNTKGMQGNNTGRISPSMQQKAIDNLRKKKSDQDEIFQP